MRFDERALASGQAALEWAGGQRIHVGVVVLDERGTVACALTADGAYPSAFEVARAKARTALNFRASTAALRERIRPENQRALAEVVGGLMFVGGGVPLLEGERVIGAVGVSGGTEDQDGECAARAAAGFEGA